MSPAVSKRQARFMGAELARKRAGKKTVTGMSEKQLKEFAQTKRSKLPARKPIMKIIPMPERRLKEIAMPERRLKEKPVRKPTMRVIPMPERRLKVEFAQTRKKKRK